MKQYLTKLSSDNKAEIFEQVIYDLCDKCADGENLENLNETERPLIISQLIQDSINGGGINSFFYNNANRYVSEGLVSFKKIGLIKVYEIFQNAVNAFPNDTIPNDIEECRLIMEGLPDDNPTDEKWYELTDEFYSLEDYILNQNIEYIKMNINNFGL